MTSKPDMNVGATLTFQYHHHASDGLVPRTKTVVVYRPSCLVLAPFLSPSVSVIDNLVARSHCRQIFFGLPGSALECIMLIAPAHRMAGTQPTDTASTFYVYAGRWQGRTVQRG